MEPNANSEIFVSPSTMMAISSPNSVRISSTVVSVSSTTSWRSEAAMLTVSSRISMRILATSTQWRM